MLKPGWIIGLAMAFVLLSIISGICELTAPLSASVVSRVDILMNPSLTNITGWLGNLWSMMWFDYPFLTGSYSLVRYIFFMPISIGIVAILAITIAQLLMTALGGIGRLLFR